MTNRSDVQTDRPDSDRTDPAGRDEIRPEVAADAAQSPRGERAAPLLDEGAASSLAGRWEHIQSGFLDSPQQAVEDADHLVQEVMGQLAQRMTEQRQRLDDQWRGGQEVNTEDLRRTLKQYRSFFERLLAA